MFPLHINSQLPEAMLIIVASRGATSFRDLEAYAGGADEPNGEPCPLPESRRRFPLLGTILVVDDEEAIRKTVRSFLERLGFGVQEAGDGEEALQKADTLKESLAVLVTDAVMPGMSGTELAHLLKRKHLGLPLVFMSGYPAGEQVHQLFERATFLQKPFSRAALVNAVCTVLETCPKAKTSEACVTSK